MRGVAAAVTGGVAIVVAAVFGAESARALPPDEVGLFAVWDLAGVPTDFGGSAVFSNPVVPDEIVHSTSATIATPDGTNAWLGANTGFGREYGTSYAQSFVTLRPQTRGLAPNPPSLTSPTPSVTTITFPSSPAPGWGIALGDIDSDWVTVSATDAAGNLY